MALTLLLLACTGTPDDSEDTRPPDDTGIEDTDDTGETDTEDSGDTDTDSPPDPDADADGYDSYADGGDDCDDFDPTVFPGAAEACDEKDHDCDGATLAPGVCSADGDAGVSSHWLVRDPAVRVASMAVVADLTGDDVADFLVGRGPTGGYTAFPGGAWPRAPYAIPDEAWLTLEPAVGISGLTEFDAGDVDGDGLRDLGAVGHSSPYLFFYLAPFTEGESRGEDEEDLAMAGTGDSFGYRAQGGLDFDGDGRADAVSDVWQDGLADLTVFFGMDPARCDLGDNADGRMSVAWAIGDQTGDGFDDISYWTTAGTLLLDGSLFRGACGVAEPADVAFAESVRLSGGDEDLSGPWTPIGDWSGDGIDDLVLGQSASTGDGEWVGALLFFDAPPEDGFSAGSAVGSYVGPYDGTIGVEVQAVDFDGDGVNDLVTSAGNDTLVIRGGSVPGPHTPLPERHLFYDTNDEHTLGATALAWAGDYNGDGFADVASFQRTDTYADLGVIAGFAVPWDDDTYW